MHAQRLEVVGMDPAFWGVSLAHRKRLWLTGIVTVTKCTWRITMLITPQINRRNQRLAAALAFVVVVFFLLLGGLNPWCWLGVVLGPAVYWGMRRKCRRRLRVMSRPFPKVWEAVLQTKVAYFSALDEEQKERFRQLVKIFLDETRITGIRTDVDETTRVLVAASAIIPIFSFDQWEYTWLGEVLIYPGSFNENYGTDQSNILGMVGAGHLTGVMILSKPSLIAGFDLVNDKRNVGIHEFAHLLDRGDGSIDGIPPGVPADLSCQWIQWVAEELSNPPEDPTHINPYAYTNEAEYFAVLVEYFFEAPDVLKKKNPELYAMLEKMIRQDTASLLTKALNFHRPRRLGRNSPCPCGSGKKYKRCCLRLTSQGFPE